MPSLQTLPCEKGGWDICQKDSGGKRVPFLSQSPRATTGFPPCGLHSVEDATQVLLKSSFLEAAVENGHDLLKCWFIFVGGGYELEGLVQCVAEGLDGK